MGDDSMYMYSSIGRTKESKGSSIGKSTVSSRIKRKLHYNQDEMLQNTC